jgi:DNA polymerase-1
MAQIAIWVLGYSRMAEVLNSGQNAHTLIAAEFMGITVRRDRPAEEGAARRGILRLREGLQLRQGRRRRARATTVYHAREKDGIRFCVSTGEQPTECGLSKRPRRCAGR